MLQTPLHYAAANGHEKIVRLLLDNGADVNINNVTTSLSLFFLFCFVFYFNLFLKYYQKSALELAQENYEKCAQDEHQRLQQARLLRVIMLLETVIQRR
jgi:ankyrin repeat protein